MYVGEGRVVVVWVGGSVGMLMTFVWRSLDVGRVCKLGWGVFGGAGGWLSEFWTSDIIYILILTKDMLIAHLTQFGQKGDWVSFGKTLYKVNAASQWQKVIADILIICQILFSWASRMYLTTLCIKQSLLLELGKLCIYAVHFFLSARINPCFQPIITILDGWPL